MKKRAILFGAASLALVASPIFGLSANAAGTYEYKNVEEAPVFADVTFAGRHTFTGQYGKALYELVAEKNATVPEGSADKGIYCGYVDEHGWSEEGLDTQTRFCLEQVEDNVVSLFRSGDTIENEVRVAEINNLLSWETQEYDDERLVVTVTTHTAPLRVYYGFGYAVMEGDGQDHPTGSSDGLTFHVTGSYEDNFDGVLVDGREIESYEAKSGSTIVTLPSDYLNTLAVGEHTLTIRYRESNTAGAGEATAKFAVSGNPETASDGNIMMTFVISVVSLGGIAVSSAFLSGRRR